MYRIFDLVKPQDQKEFPCGLNYKIDVVNSLDRKDTFVQGRLLKVRYYNTEGRIVLSVAMVYTNDPKNKSHPMQRTATRKWYDVAGKNHNILNSDVTVRVKNYSPNQVIDEGIRRRRNAVNHVFSTASAMGYTTQAAAYVRNEAAAINSYTLTNDQNIIQTLAKDSAVWLDEHAYGKKENGTMRQLVVAVLTILD